MIEAKTSLTSEEKVNTLYEDCERSSARVTYNKNMQIVDTNNYYPFGMNHLRDDAPSNFGQGSYKNYKFQEQELQETGFYSFKWRNYMPDVGRFFNVDPLSEKYAYQSHYNFSENRVVDAVELEGLEKFEIIQKHQMIERLSGGNPQKRKELLAAYAEGERNAIRGAVRYFTPIEDIYGAISGKDFDGNDYHRGKASVWAAASFIPFAKLGKLGKLGKVVTKNGDEIFQVSDNVSDAFKEATREGGKHSGMLENVLKLDMTPSQIEQSIDTYMNGKRGILTHKDKIANPAKYVKNWDNLRKGHQENLIKGWKTEIQNNYEKIDILKDLLKK